MLQLQHLYICIILFIRFNKYIASCHTKFSFPYQLLLTDWTNDNSNHNRTGVQFNVKHSGDKF